MMVHLRPVAHGEAPAAVQQLTGDGRLVGRLAQRRTADRAHRAAATARHEGKHHMIIRLQPLHPGTHVADDPGRLVPHHHRHRARARAVDHRKIGMAQSRAGHLHQHLVFSGTVEFHLLDRKRTRLRIRPGQFHLSKDGCLGFHARQATAPLGQAQRQSPPIGQALG